MSEKHVSPSQQQSDMHEKSEEHAKQILTSDYNVSRETMGRFESYRQLLVKWTAQINLVGPSTLDQFWARHVLDCAQISDITGAETRSFADFGSGAGLPGLIISTLLKDQGIKCHGVLIESSAKRCGFLREAARTLDVKIDIVQQKIEVVIPFAIDLVTARAFAPLDKLLSYAHPWSELGARVIFLKGGDVQTEIDQASTKWSFQSRINTSVTDSRGCVVEILELKRL